MSNYIKIKEHFFYLLSSALGFKYDKPIEFPITEKQWLCIWEIAKRQTVCGLIFSEIEKLPNNMQPPKKLMIEFWVFTEQIKKINIKMDSVAQEIISWFEVEGLEPIIIKGMTVGSLYPIPELRMPGDIDLFFHKNYNKAVSIVQKKGINVTLDPNHDKFIYKNIPIELHHTCFKTIYPIKNLDFSPSLSCNNNFKGNTLKIKANALLLLIHPANHFMNEGIGLRHLCDWALFLKKYENYAETEEAWNEVKKQGAERFAIEFTAIAVHYLGLKLNNNEKWIGKSNPKLRKKMLQIIMKRGNFANDIKKFRTKDYLKYWYLLAIHVLDVYPYWKIFFWIYTPKRIAYRLFCIILGKPLASK